MLWVGWIIGFLIPLITGICFVIASISVAKRRRFRHLIPLTVGALVTSLAVSIILAFTFWGAFGPGLTLGIASMVSAVGAFLAVITIGTILLLRTRHESGFRQALLALYLIGGILVPASLLAPIGGACATWGVCDTWHRQKAEPVILASEQYRRDAGKYPKDIGTLEPQYLAEIPTATCLVPYRLLGFWDPYYRIVHCGQKTTLLTIPGTDGVRAQRYDFASGDWSRYDPVDGPCLDLGQQETSHDHHAAGRSGHPGPLPALRGAACFLTSEK